MIDILLDVIRKFVKANESHYSVTKKAGLADRTLKDIDDDNWNPTVRTIRNLEKIIPDEFILTEFPDISKHYIFSRKEGSK